MDAQKLRNNMTGSELISKARSIAATTLSEDLRSDGTPMIAHAEGVARIVENEIGLSPECIAAVYLHEASRFHPDADISGFSEEVYTMVDGLNKIATIKPKDTRLEAEN